MKYLKSNTKLKKEIDGHNVQIILTVEGLSNADWHNRHTKAINDLEKLGYVKVS